MHCPKCNFDNSHVLRTTEKSEFILRKRECKRCKWRFNTKEMLSDDWNYKALYKELVREMYRILRKTKKNQQG